MPDEAVPAETSRRTCGTMSAHQRLLLEEPTYAINRAAIENHALEYARTQGANARVGVTVIPVVVHVVFNTPAQNISDAQINSQLTVLNHDFRMTNTDLPKIPAPFKPLAADARIQFVLASKDPANNPTTGITRTSTTSTSFTDDDKVKRTATGGADAWPTDRYLNVWVCPLGGLLGYAQFPGGPAATDGVVITYTGFGTVGTAAVPFNLGRSATHEIGHFFNLLHIWGDDGGACTGTDMVGDTPNQSDHNFGKPAFPHVTCGNGPNGDMFMNYMDYTDDDSMFMFTAGQVTRMQAALDGPRANLGTPRVVTSKFFDDVGPVTLKFNDDHGTTKFSDDTPVTLKFRDDIVATLKFLDDHGASLKFLDDRATKPPVSDLPKGPGSDNPGFPGPQSPVGHGSRAQSGSAVPFILATPHHSRAWAQSFPQAFLAAVQLYEQRLGQIEEILQQYQQGEQAGKLSDTDRQEANQVYAEYQRLMAEYTNLTQG